MIGTRDGRGCVRGVETKTCPSRPPAIIGGLRARDLEAINRPIDPSINHRSIEMAPLFRATVHGAPRTKKTSNRIVRVRGRSLVLPSKANQDWSGPAVLQLRAQMKGRPAIATPVNCRALFYRDARRGDAVGYYQALADALEAAGVVVNDVLIETWDGSRLFVDRHAPRIELELTPLVEP